MSNALLVVDMSVGFMVPGHNLYCGDEGRKIIPNVQRLIEKEQARGSKVFFICDTHDPDDLEFEVYPTHCIRGSGEEKVIPELAGYYGELIPKRRYTGFFETDLADRLAELKPEKTIVCGVATDGCVLYTVADARIRDCPVEVPVDCVYSSNPEGHAYALKHMEDTLGVKLVGAAITAAT